MSEHRRVEKRVSALPDGPDSLEKEKQETTSWESLKSEKENTLKELASHKRTISRIRGMAYAVLFVLVLDIGGVIVLTAQVSYVNSATVHFHRVLKIASPHLELAEGVTPPTKTGVNRLALAP